MYLQIWFSIRGDLRFLSHTETVNMFIRAFARSGLQVAHSKGFNPRMKLSVAVPRSVGIEADNELLNVSVLQAPDRVDIEIIKQGLRDQFPKG